MTIFKQNSGFVVTVKVLSLKKHKKNHTILKLSAFYNFEVMDKLFHHVPCLHYWLSKQKFNQRSKNIFQIPVI